MNEIAEIKLPLREKPLGRYFYIQHQHKGNDRSAVFDLKCVDLSRQSRLVDRCDLRLLGVGFMKEVEANPKIDGFVNTEAIRGSQHHAPLGVFWIQIPRRDRQRAFRLL